MTHASKVGIDDLVRAGATEAELNALPREDLTERLPWINARDQDLAKVSDEAWAAVREANEPAVFFRHGGVPARIERDDDGVPVVHPLTLDRVRHALARVARWYTPTKKGERIPALPPIPVVRDLLARPDPPLPVLTRIVEAPVFAPDGSLQTLPGYHPGSRTFYAPAPGFTIPPMPPCPSAEAVAQARQLLLDELLGDFPFVGAAERAHAVSLLLLPFVRELIEGATPNHLIEKPSPGTGATLLAEVLLLPAMGRRVSTLTEGRDEDEWRKRLTAKLASAPTVVLIDNLRRRLESPALSAAITTSAWEDRRLGQSEMIRIPVRCAWITTGNNPALSAELARRTIRIRLDAKVDRPWLRAQFHHTDLRSWATEHRAELVSAALTLVQAWLATGQPDGGDAQRRPGLTTPSTTPSTQLGMFEDWTRVMGGILTVAGVGGFLGNLEDFYAQSDAEGAAWRMFVGAWWERYGEQAVGVSDLFHLAVPDGDPLLDLGLGDGSEKSQRTRLGNLLVQNRDRQFDGLRIVRAGERKRAQIWRLVSVPAG